MAKRRMSAAQRAKLRRRLEALRRKHRLGEFQTKKARKAPKTRKKRTMAKRKVGRRKSGLMSGLGRPVVAGVTYAFVQPFVSQFLSRFNIGIQDELAQILAAVVLKQMVKNPIVTNYANAAIIVNTASLASGFASRFTQGATAQAPQTEVNVIG